ncbi:MAG TPA: hypothetical protein VNA22_01160 [Pyrinomonadaceae bacterium]|nr:hypothetical protein [Pyrinomonadaceae bacterium]
MNIYLGTFLIAFSTLALEITLSRLLSVSTWYHLAFFAISTAMLGMTAGATTVYLKRDWIEKRNLNDTVALACLGYSIVLPVVLVLICLIPIKMERTLMPALSLLVISALCTAPFYFSGLALSIILTKYALPIGRLYAVDLIGAALGCLFVLGGLEIFSGPTIVLICAFIGAVSAFVFAVGSKTFAFRKTLAGVALVIASLIAVNLITPKGIYQLATKGSVVTVEQVLIERWNSHSRVLVYKPTEGGGHYWGPSPKMPEGEKTTLYSMNIDGDAFTSVRKYSSNADIANLAYDVTNTAYFLRPKGGACIIGVGGGRDMQSALLFGHERVLGIDVNPVFINLQQSYFKDFAGLGNNPNVRLVADEARSYLTHTDEKFSVLQMSMIDTWASTGAGAFSLSENGLYTVEAWNVFFDRLSDDGIFTVSRWFNPEAPGEAGRILSLSVASLLQKGISDPSKHIALVKVGKVSTLLLSKQPLSAADIENLNKVAGEKSYDVLVAPGMESKDKILGDIVHAKSDDELEAVVADATFNLEPSTDESPYFFNMLRLSDLAFALRAQPGVVAGNLLATVTLAGLILCLGVISAITIIVPLVAGVDSGSHDSTSARAHRLGALYFCLIGAGFMFAEIAIIQKLSIFLGHPVYAMGILLFTVIASTGIGSFVSDRIPLSRWSIVSAVPIVTAVVVLLQKFILSFLVTESITQPIFTKALMCIAAIFPLGILLGFFFPSGMKLFKPLVSGDTPWFWALNGIFGVLSSATAVFISIYFGISINFYVAAICYAVLFFVIQKARDLYNGAGLNGVTEELR